MEDSPLGRVVIRVVESIPPSMKHVVDTAAAGTAVATLAKWLPPIAAAFSIVWLGLQIYTWIEHRIESRKFKKPKD